MWWLLSAALAAPVSPDEVVRLALDHDPDVAMAAGIAQGARGAQAASSGLRHNPELDVRVGVTGDKLEVELAQPISVSGEGVAASRSARAGLASAEAGLARERYEAAARARRAYVAVVVADAELGLARQELDLATRLREAAEARVAAGDTPELDARLARLDQAAAAGRLVDAQRAVTAARADLSAITGLGADVEVVADPLLAAPDPSGGQPRSDARAAEAAVDAARAAVRREQAAVLPAVVIGAFVDDAVVGPAVGVEIPLWQRNDAARAEARGDLAHAEAVRDAVAARIAAEQAAAPELLAVGARTSEVLGDVTADAAAALDAVGRAYDAGEIGIVEVGALRVRIVDGQRGWYAARASAAEAKIDALLATEDPALLGTAR